MLFFIIFGFVLYFSWPILRDLKFILTMLVGLTGDLLTLLWVKIEVRRCERDLSRTFSPLLSEIIERRERDYVRALEARTTN